MEKIIEIVRSGHGIPCLWEKGGGYSHIGDARIIANKNGEPKRPLYVRQRGDLACKEHALIPVREGDLIVLADRYWEDVTVECYQITRIDDDTAEIKPVPVIKDAAMVQAAIEKSADYHCRTAYYIAE